MQVSKVKLNRSAWPEYKTKAKAKETTKVSTV